MFIYIWYDSLPLFGCCRCFVSFSSEFPEKYYIFLGRWKPVGVSPYRAQAPNSPRNLYLPLEIPLLRTRFHSYLWIEREMGPRMAPNLSICYLVSVSPELGLLSPEPSGGARPQPHLSLSLSLSSRGSSWHQSHHILTCMFHFPPSTTQRSSIHLSLPQHPRLRQGPGRLLCNTSYTLPLYPHPLVEASVRDLICPLGQSSWSKSRAKARIPHEPSRLGFPGYLGCPHREC